MANRRDSSPSPLPRRRVRRGAIGVLEKSGKLLLIQRAHGIPKGGTWCFPGGHVEPGETSRSAVCREFVEELNLEVKPIRRLGAARVPDSRHVLAVWSVCSERMEIAPNPSEIADFQWLTPSEVLALEDGLPSNATVLGLLGCCDDAITSCVVNQQTT